MEWREPKTDWASNDVVSTEDLNRIEGNINALPNMIKKITGKTNWYDAPDTTLAAAKTHIDASYAHGISSGKYVAQSSRSDRLVDWAADIYGKPTALTRTLHIATGTISDGGTIPQTRGYSKYAYFVSFRYASDPENLWISGVECYVVQSTRKVTARYAPAGSPTTWKSATANYIEIAWNEV